MGHIFFISPSSPGSLDKLSQWTFRWLLEHGELMEDATMYTCNSIEDATSLLESALIIGQSPALIILDHTDNPKSSNLDFSKCLHDGIPESWIVEIVPDSMPIPQSDDNLFWVRRPISEEEWYSTLDQVLLKSASPQWAGNDI
ncbi:MAG: hypothetical protein HUK20_14855 [Fibrobacter sp.]|nr:hypothetical protein [Fibrobacter sp.]